MNHRSRVATTAALLLFLLVSVLAVRGAVRGLTAPFEGLERLAQSRKAAPPQLEPTIEETVRAIDWDAPAPEPQVRAAGAGSTPAVRAGGLLAVVARREPVELSYQLTLRAIAADEFVYFGAIGNEIDIDSLASTLKLSDSQKARIAGLLEWRRWWLDGISDADKANAESMKKFDESFHEAVKMELDQDQAQAYQKIRSPRVQLLEYRGAARLALEQIHVDGTKTQMKQEKKTAK